MLLYILSIALLLTTDVLGGTVKIQKCRTLYTPRSVVPDIKTKDSTIYLDPGDVYVKTPYTTITPAAVTVIEDTSVPVTATTTETTIETDTVSNTITTTLPAIVTAPATFTYLGTTISSKRKRNEAQPTQAQYIAKISCKNLVYIAVDDIPTSTAETETETAPTPTFTSTNTISFTTTSPVFDTTTTTATIETVVTATPTSPSVYEACNRELTFLSGNLYNPGPNPENLVLTGSGPNRRSLEFIDSHSLLRRVPIPTYNQVDCCMACFAYTKGCAFGLFNFDTCTIYHRDDNSCPPDQLTFGEHSGEVANPYESGPIKFFNGPCGQWKRIGVSH